MPVLGATHLVCVYSTVHLRWRRFWLLFGANGQHSLYGTHTLSPRTLSLSYTARCPVCVCFLRANSFLLSPTLTQARPQQQPCPACLLARPSHRRPRRRRSWRLCRQRWPCNSTCSTSSSRRSTSGRSSSGRSSSATGRHTSSSSSSNCRNCTGQQLQLQSTSVSVGP